MAQGGILGIGALIGYDLASPGGWTEFTQLLEIGFPVDEAERVDKTTHNRTSRRKRYMPGLIDTSDPFIVQLADDDDATSPDQAAMRTAYDDGTLFWVRIEKPVNRALTSFKGFEMLVSVRNIQDDTPIAGPMTRRTTFAFEGESIGRTGPGASEF